MKRYGANTQLKLIFYIVLIGLGAYFIQGKYNIFRFENSIKEETSIERTIYLEKQNGERIPIQVEIAESEKERAQGLMNRSNLEEHKGMLFLFPEDSINGFWMKNTLIPLDMIFIDSNRKVVAIEENAQPCTESPCKVYNPEVVYRYVVEVNGGWVDKNSVNLGDTFDIRTVTSGS